MSNIILIVLISGATLVFSMQNAGGVIVSFLVWQFEISLSTVTVVAVLAGILLAQSLRAAALNRRGRAKKTLSCNTLRHR